MAAFRQIEAWVFDLDNTLYEAECQLFKQIDARMTAFIEERFGFDYDEARRLQKDYYVRYGTTMSGLMHEHDMCPEEFLAFVHDIDLATIKPNPSLGAALKALPGRRFIYTNGSRQHAENVAGALGIFDLFDDVYDIRSAGFTPKPRRESYDQFIARHEINPARAAMFEDLPQNLEAPHALGMTTVLVCSDAAWLADEPADKRPAKPGDKPPHAHYVTDNLTQFLQTALA